MRLKLADNTEVTIHFTHFGSAADKRVATRAIVEMVEGLTVVSTTGFAYAHPDDQFNKRTGRKISLARALENYSREFRTLVWQAYGKYTGAF